MLLKTVLFVLLAMAVHASPIENPKSTVLAVCIGRNATDKVQQVTILMDEYKNCYPEMIHVEQLPDEFLKAQTVTVDEVARKQCAKAALTKTCLAKLNHAMMLCSKDAVHARDLMDAFFGLEASDSAIDYMCYVEDGKTRLAKFVDDGGMRCFASRSFNLPECKLNIRDLKTAIENDWKCAISSLKACSNPAAILLQGMYDYIRNERPSSSNSQLV